MRIAFISMLAACGGGGGGAAAPDASETDAPGSTVDAYDGPTITRTYQQGIDGYAGTKSVGISTYGGLGNLGAYNENGMTFADGQNDWCTGTDIPSGNYSEVWLLRFDDLGIDAGRQVVSATLSIHGYGDGSSDLYYAGGYLAVPWYGDTPESCAGCSNSPVGWRYANTSGAPWGALGAAAAGTDTVGSAAFRLPEVGTVNSGSAPTEYTTALDPAIVQTWIDGNNYGVRIVAGESNVHMGYVQSQRDTSGRPETMRPKLTITYANN